MVSFGLPGLPLRYAAVESAAATIVAWLRFSLFLQDVANGRSVYYFFTTADTEYNNDDISFADVEL